MSFVYKKESDARLAYNEAMDQKDPKPYFALLIAQRNLDAREMVAPLTLLLSKAIKERKVEEIKDLLYRYPQMIDPDLKEHIVELVVSDFAKKGKYIEAIDYAISEKDCSADRLSKEFHKKATEEKKFDIAAIIYDRYKLGPEFANDAAVKLYLSQIKENDTEGALFTVKMYPHSLKQYLLPVLLRKAKESASKLLKDEFTGGKVPQIKITFE